MKHFALAVVVAFPLAFPLFAQQPLDPEGQLREHAKTLGQLTADFNQQSNALVMLKRAANLDTMQPTVTVNRSVELVNEYIRRMEREGPVLSHNAYFFVTKAREMLVTAQRGPETTNIAQLAEDLHHQVIHPMQVQLGQNARMLDRLMKQYQTLLDTSRATLARTVEAAIGTM
jgi:hypothetical protein